MQASVKEDRNKYIGGSDIPIIMGISPFKSRFDLLLEKAELKENDFDGNEYTEYGNTMEPKIREYINKKYNTEYTEGKHILEEEGIRIHTDGETPEAILEIKTTSQIHEEVGDYKVYLVQLLFYMENTNKKKGQLAIYSRPDDFSEEFDKSRLQVYTIDYDDYQEMIEEINRAVAQFRIDLGRLKENPLLTEEELVPADIREIADKVVYLEQQLTTYKILEKQYEEAKAQLKTGMENKGLKKWTTPAGILITLTPDTPDKEVEESYFNEEKLQEEKPEIYQEYTETRTITKKGRKGYVRITIPKE